MVSKEALDKAMKLTTFNDADYAIVNVLIDAVIDLTERVESLEEQLLRQRVIKENLV